MVLSGLIIALGLIIDDAVVDVEHIVRRLRRNRQEGNPETAENVILAASVEIRGTLFLATLIILLAVLPVFFLQGLSGGLFQPLALSYLLAVLAAMVVALTVTPVLSLWLLPSENVESRESPLASGLRRSYERLLTRSVKNSKLAYAVIVILIVVGLVVVPFLRQEQLLPSFLEPYVMVRMNGMPGTSQPEMSRIVSRASTELRTLPGVKNVGAHVGRAVSGDQVVGINSAEMWVSIDPGADYDATMAAIQETVNGYPGLDREVRTYMQDSLNRLQPINSNLYTVRLYGDDYQVLRSEVEKVRQTVAGVAGVADAQSVLPLEEPTLEIEVDLAVAQRYGVKAGDVRRAAATLLSGINVGSLFEEQKIFDVVVWAKPEVRHNLSDIRNLLIDTPGGGHVRLGEVADVRVAPAPTVINREAISPYLDVVFDIRGRNVAAVLNEIETDMQSYPFPLEYHAEVQYDYQAQSSALQVTLVSGLIALIGIFLLLQAASESWLMALATFLTVPAALAGGLLAALLGGSTIASVSLFGLLAVLGIGVRNSVLLIKHYHMLEREGEVFGPGQVLQGASERLVPILMTTLATGLALLPFVLLGNSTGLEIVRPTAIVILGGMVTSTYVNLFVLPALYLRFGARREADLGFAPVPATGEA
jgi:Cu/Ag efflux pump CusA